MHETVVVCEIAVQMQIGSTLQPYCKECYHENQQCHQICPPVHTIAQLFASAATESEVTYSIASTEYRGEEESLFQIDQTSQLIISWLLDQEK